MKFKRRAVSLTHDLSTKTGEAATDKPEATLMLYVDDLYSYAVVLTRNHHEAEDLVQETYVRALQALQGLRPDSNVKGWLFTVLRNVWLNQLRQQKARPRMVELDVDGQSVDVAVVQSPDPLAQYTSKWVHLQLRKAILELPAEFREILVLREYQEMSYEEIARLLSCPAGTVMSRLARARSKLRSLLHLLSATPGEKNGEGTPTPRHCS